mmetsp:Transcript_52906/g.153976  ORF Transcript_52906/g.153976 Transcript_52906/m.153976 type:complete len:209 (-) Transcript_52906:3794-4420(-)
MPPSLETPLRPSARQGAIPWHAVAPKHVTPAVLRAPPRLQEVQQLWPWRTPRAPACRDGTCPPAMRALCLQAPPLEPRRRRRLFCAAGSPARPAGAGACWHVRVTKPRRRPSQQTARTASRTHSGPNRPRIWLYAAPLNPLQALCAVVASAWRGPRGRSRGGTASSGCCPPRPSAAPRRRWAPRLPRARQPAPRATSAPRGARPPGAP